MLKKSVIKELSKLKIHKGTSRDNENVLYLHLDDGYLVSPFVKTHQSECLKYVQFIVCKIHETIQNYQNL